MTAALVLSALLQAFPLNLDLSLWYAPTSLSVLAVVTVTAVAAFYVSLGGRALMSDLGESVAVAGARLARLCL